MPHSRILVERAGPVATVLIDRAEKRNCLDLPMWEAMAEIFAELSADTALGCVILRGAGNAAFCAGADISRFGEEYGDPDRNRRYAAALDGALEAVRNCTHPVVAAVSGWCMGGGAGLASVCDFRVGGEGTRIGIPARRLNVWYPHAAMDVLLQIVGYPVACELLIEGRVFGGREALAKCMLTRCVADAEVQAEARALAARIVQGAPQANRFHKRALRELRGAMPIPPPVLAAATQFPQTEDFQEAVRAFQEKREPVFQGR